MSEKVAMTEEDFSHFVATALTMSEEMLHKIARAFEVSRGTVNRWANGDSVPTSLMREVIIERTSSLTREAFPGFIKNALASGSSISDKLADEVRVNTGTIGRWASGVSIPPALTRGVIVERVNALLKNKTNALDEPFV